MESDMEKRGKHQMKIVVLQGYMGDLGFPSWLLVRHGGMDAP